MRQIFYPQGISNALRKILISHIVVFEKVKSVNFPKLFFIERGLLKLKFMIKPFF